VYPEKVIIGSDEARGWIESHARVSHLENCVMYILTPLYCFSIMITSKLVNVCDCPLVRQTQQQFLKASIDLKKQQKSM